MLQPIVEASQIEADHLIVEDTAKKVLCGTYRLTHSDFSLMAGALVCAQPSYDVDLNCYDFMTVIDVDQATDSLIHHYNL